MRKSNPVCPGWSSAIEPIILVFMGGVIAVLLYAFYLPLFQLTQWGSGREQPVSTHIDNHGR